MWQYSTQSLQIFISCCFPHYFCLLPRRSLVKLYSALYYVHYFYIGFLPICSTVKIKDSQSRWHWHISEPNNRRWWGSLPAPHSRTCWWRGTPSWNTFTPRSKSTAGKSTAWNTRYQVPSLFSGITTLSLYSLLTILWKPVVQCVNTNRKKR